MCGSVRESMRSDVRRSCGLRPSGCSDMCRACGLRANLCRSCGPKLLRSCGSQLRPCQQLLQQWLLQEELLENAEDQVPEAVPAEEQLLQEQLRQE